MDINGCTFQNLLATFSETGTLSSFTNFRWPLMAKYRFLVIVFATLCIMVFFAQYILILGSKSGLFTQMRGRSFHSVELSSSSSDEEEEESISPSSGYGLSQ
uniref:Uncharacterized protein n=1 Tax=Cacopsylla melanoneura TaxID=428564 RepID=A0A8D8PUT7_9HEMI